MNLYAQQHTPLISLSSTPMGTVVEIDHFICIWNLNSGTELKCRHFVSRFDPVTKNGKIQDQQQQQKKTLQFGKIINVQCSTIKCTPCASCVPHPIYKSEINNE